jgi:hypothetical protein
MREAPAHQWVFMRPPVGFHALRANIPKASLHSVPSGTKTAVGIRACQQVYMRSAPVSRKQPLSRAFDKTTAIGIRACQRVYMPDCVKTQKIEIIPLYIVV